MKFLALGVIAAMVLITVGYANSVDQMVEAELRDAQLLLEQQLAEEEAAASQGMATARAPAITGQH